MAVAVRIGGGIEPVGAGHTGSRVDSLAAAQKAACEAYRNARNHDDGHAALQRMLALGLANEYRPCQKPQCVALRQKTALEAGIYACEGPPPDWSGLEQLVALRHTLQL